METSTVWLVQRWNRAWFGWVSSFTRNRRWSQTRCATKDFGRSFSFFGLCGRKNGCADHFGLWGRSFSSTQFPEQHVEKGSDTWPSRTQCGISTSLGSIHRCWGCKKPELKPFDTLKPASVKTVVLRFASEQCYNDQSKCSWQSLIKIRGFTLANGAHVWPLPALCKTHGDGQR